MHKKIKKLVGLKTYELLACLKSKRMNEKVQKIERRTFTARERKNGLKGQVILKSGEQ